jgi:hypothetical protein
MRASQRRFEGMFTMTRKTARPLVWESSAHVASGDVMSISKKRLKRDFG